MPFLPCGNILFYVGATKAERWLYLPSFGSCFALALALAALTRSPRVSSNLVGKTEWSNGQKEKHRDRLRHRMDKKGSEQSGALQGREGRVGREGGSSGRWWAVVATLVVILGAYGQQTAIRDRDWSKNLLLWRAAVEATPGNGQALKNYGAHLLEAEALESAADVLRRGFDLDPVDRGIHDPTFYLEMTLWKLKRHDEAREVALEGLRRLETLPTHFGSWDQEMGRVAGLLGVVQAELGDFPSARHWAAEAARRNSEQDPHINSLIEYATALADHGMKGS